MSSRRRKAFDEAVKALVNEERLPSDLREAFEGREEDLIALAGEEDKNTLVLGASAIAGLLFALGMIESLIKFSSSQSPEYLPYISTPLLLLSISMVIHCAKGSVKVDKQIDKIISNQTEAESPEEPEPSHQPA